VDRDRDLHFEAVEGARRQEAMHTMGLLRDIDHPERHSEELWPASGGHSVRFLYLSAGNRRIEVEHFVHLLLVDLPADSSNAASFASALEGA